LACSFYLGLTSLLLRECSFVIVKTVYVMHNSPLGLALAFNTRCVDQLTTKKFRNTYHVPVPVLVPVWVIHTSEARKSGAFTAHVQAQTLVI